MCAARNTYKKPLKIHMNLQRLLLYLSLKHLIIVSSKAVTDEVYDILFLFTILFLTLEKIYIAEHITANTTDTFIMESILK